MGTTGQLSWCACVLGALLVSACSRSLEEKCNSGDGMACGVLADREYNRAGAGSDLTRACVLYRQGCTGKNDAACTSLGSLLAQSKCEGEPGEALRVLERACDHGDAAGCNNLGMLYSDGTDGLRPDSTRAKGLFRKACESEAIACDNLGALLLGQKDEAGAMAAFKTGCDLPGEDMAKAICCFNLGLSYENGWGVPVDLTRASELYLQACDRGVGDACYFLGLAELESNKEQAAGHFRRACEAGVAGGCNNLGLMYSNGLGVPRDAGLAVEFLEKACNGGERRACANVGSRYVLGDGVPKDAVRGAQLIERACRGGVSEACQPPAE